MANNGSPDGSEPQLSREDVNLAFDSNYFRDESQTSTRSEPSSEEGFEIIEIPNGSPDGSELQPSREDVILAFDTNYFRDESQTSTRSEPSSEEGYEIIEIPNDSPDCTDPQSLGADIPVDGNLRNESDVPARLELAPEERFQFKEVSNGRNSKGSHSTDFKVPPLSMDTISCGGLKLQKSTEVSKIDEWTEQSSVKIISSTERSVQAIEEKLHEEPNKFLSQVQKIESTEQYLRAMIASTEKTIHDLNEKLQNMVAFESSLRNEMKESEIQIFEETKESSAPNEILPAKLEILPPLTSLPATDPLSIFLRDKRDLELNISLIMASKDDTSPTRKSDSSDSDIEVIEDSNADECECFRE